MQDKYSRIIGLMSVFQEETILPTSLTSVIAYLDKIVIIDGAYPDWPSKNAKSEDRTKEIAERLAGDKLIWLETPTRFRESAKLDHALDRIEQEPDREDLWVFLQSADEMFTGDYCGELDEVRITDPSQCRIAQLHFKEPGPHGTSYLMPRLFRLTGGGVRHGNTSVQDCMYPRKILEKPWYPGKMLNHCFLVHLQEARDPERMKQRKMWYSAQAVAEPAPLEQAIFQSASTVRSKSEIAQEILTDDVENYRRKKPIKPRALLVIMNVRRIPEVITALEKLDWIDKLYVRNYGPAEVSDAINKWLERRINGYTHIMLTSDDVTPSPENIRQLLKDVEEYDLPVVAGYCNRCHFDRMSDDGKSICGRCVTGQDHVESSVTFLPVSEPISASSYEFLSLEWTRKHPGIKRVWFQGNACGIISVEVLKKIQLRSFYNGKGGLMQDLAMAYDLARYNIPQFVDFRVFMNHLGTHHGKLSVGKEDPRIDFEPKKT